MTVHFVVYDIATGTVQRAGICLEQDIEKQAGQGEAVMRATAGVTAVVEMNLEPVRDAMRAQVDAEAEAFRLRFITPGAGQAITYLRKEQEAAAYLADPGATVPILAAEAAAIGMTVADLAQEVADASAQWLAIGTAIEARRRAAKKAIADATTIAEIHTAATVDWQALLDG